MNTKQIHEDYIMLRHGGLTQKQALEHFAYLSFDQFAVLKSLINKPEDETSYVGIVDMENTKALSALESTQPAIKI